MGLQSIAVDTPEEAGTDEDPEISRVKYLIMDATGFQYFGDRSCLTIEPLFLLKKLKYAIKKTNASFV